MKAQHDYIQICPGDIFRQEILQQTDLGKAIAAIVEAGDYVDEKIVCTLMQQYIEEALAQDKPFILDGFPRSHTSLHFLLDFLTDKNLLQDIYFLQLQAPDTICKERMLGRYVCNTCGHVDNLQMMLSSTTPTCVSCDAALTLRPGDKESVIDKRLVHFHGIIEPLLTLLEEKNLNVIHIDSTQPLSLLHKAYDEITQ